MRRLVSLFSLMAVFAIGSPVAYAQNAAVQRQDQVGPNDAKVAGSNIRVSKLIGMNIENAAGQSVGEVSDVVLNGSSGKIRYIAVTYGGFLGIGNKMFAVPYEAFKWKSNAADRSATVLMLDVTKERMEGAVGFDESSWPNFADSKYTSDLDKRYGVTRQPTPGVDTNPVPSDPSPKP